MMTIYDFYRTAAARASAVFVFLVLASVAVHAQDEVTLNFVNADIESVVKAVGEVTGKNFIIDPRVKGQINVISAKPIRRSKVYDLLLSALRLQGFAAVESGGFVRIVPEADAKLFTGPVGTTKPVGKGDQLVTQIFKLRHESANQMVNVLKPLISPNNSIMATPGTNSLVVTDYAENLDRLSKIITAIDRPAGDDIEVVPVKHMSAIDLSVILNQIYGEGTVGAGGASIPGSSGGDGLKKMTIIPETRSNALIVRGASPTRLASLLSLIHKLDTATSATGNIHVVYLRNAEAVKLATVLRAVLSGESSSLDSMSNSSTSSSFSQGMLGLNSASGTGLSSSGGSTAGSSSMGGVASTMGSSFSKDASSALSSLMGSSGDKGGMIQADPMTNALIINAPEPVYRNLRAVIDLLDARRAQVFVESLIVEVTSETAAEFGIQWQGVSGFDKSGKQLIGGTNFGSDGNILGVMSNFGTVKTGLNIGIMDGTVNIPGIGTVTNLSVLAHALESDGKTNILSTPNMLTLDNEEATIVVGQNVPFMTGSYAQTGTSATVTPFQTFDRQDVGLTLKIKPQISESGTVRLQIYQEISSIAATVMEGGLITNKRALESQVLVDDGQIIVLGGLVQDSLTGSEDSVPFLGKIPVLGYLFKSENRKRTKTNLMVFLRPYILRDPKGSQELSASRYDYITGIQRRVKFEDTIVMPNLGAPELPSIEGRPMSIMPNDSRQKPPVYPVNQAPRVDETVYYGDRAVQTPAPPPVIYSPTAAPAPETSYSSQPTVYQPPMQSPTPAPPAYVSPQQTQAPQVTAPTVQQIYAPRSPATAMPVQQTQAPREATPAMPVQTAAPRTVIVAPPQMTPTEPMPTGPLPVRRQTAYEALEAEGAINSAASVNSSER